MNKRKDSNLQVKTKITKALLLLLKEKSISEITITELIHTAGVARTSFYRNYTSKEHVITTLIHDILEDYRLNMQNEGDYFYTYENILMSFHYFHKHADYMHALHEFGYGTLILEKLNHFHEEVAGTMSSKSIERYKLYMYMGSLYNMVMTWILNGMKENIDELADMFYQIWKKQI